MYQNGPRAQHLLERLQVLREVVDQITKGIPHYFLIRELKHFGNEKISRFLSDSQFRDGNVHSRQVHS